MFSNRSLNFKLRISFSLIIVFLVIVGFISFRSLNSVIEDYDHVAKINLKHVTSLSTMDTSSREVFRRVLQYTLVGNTTEDMARIDKAIAENRKKYEEESKLRDGLDLSEDEKKLYSVLDENWNQLAPMFDQAISLAKEKDEASRAKFSEIYRGQMKKNRDAFFEALKTLIQHQNLDSAKWVEEADRTAKSAKTMILLTICIGSFSAIAIAIIISSKLTAQLRNLSTSLAEGAEIVGKASSDIAHSSESLSASVNQQAAAIQETTASAEELTAMVKKNEENTDKSTEVSKLSSQSVEVGKNSVHEMIEAIEEIHQSNQKMMNTVEKNNQNFTEIMKVISEITNKTKVINEIVFQTKLLSFNASVEAARAGEQGKGFAVVAEEVGNLAQMSGNAAKEISEMLEESTRKVESIVNETKGQVELMVNEGKEKVQKGITVAQQCNESLDQIVVHVKEVESMVGEVALASREQSVGIAEITKAMGQLDSATQMNAASSKEMAASSEELSAQARKLNDSVLILQKTIEG